jgi:hypothetical protein
MEIPAHHAFRGPTGGLHAPATTAPAFPPKQIKKDPAQSSAAQKEGKGSFTFCFVYFISQENSTHGQSPWPRKILPYHHHRLLGNHDVRNMPRKAFDELEHV